MIYTSLALLFLLRACSLVETLVVILGVVMLAVYGLFVWKTRSRSGRTRWMPMQ